MNLFGPSPPPQPIVEPVDREQRLAELLSALCDRLRAGQAIDIRAEAARHPDLADELYRLWPTAVWAAAIAAVAADSLPNAPSATPFLLPYQLQDYELLEELGRGGMGVVYRARQISLNREVAVKMLLGGPWASNTDRARLRAEAEAAARLDHPNIVPVYEVGQHEGLVYFSMKYVRGRTLADHLAAGPIGAHKTATVLARVARAVQFAHEHGVLHRDLKPSNIVLDLQNEPHVTDFGLAKILQPLPPEGTGDGMIRGPLSPQGKGEGVRGRLTGTGQVLGTPTYMSPEQAAGRRDQIGITSDVYSLGTILYHMITGRPPFVGDSPLEVVRMVIEQDPPVPRAIRPTAHRDLELIALRCLQKPRDLRYPSAAALADDLEAFLKDEPLAARSGRFSQILARMFRETHHAIVLENWGLLWMWHSLVLMVVCALTNALHWWGFRNPLHYSLVWTAGLGTWAAVFWALRQRMGPVTFVERQIAHVWAASMVAIGLLFPVEMLLGLPVLQLSPVLGLVAGMVFLVKAGMLSGTFYLAAAACFASSLAMAYWPHVALAVFGAVSSICFFLPGLKYYRQRRGSGTANYDAANTDWG